MPLSVAEDFQTKIVALVHIGICGRSTRQTIRTIIMCVRLRTGCSLFYVWNIHVGICRDVLMVCKGLCYYMNHPAIVAYVTLWNAR